MLIEEAIYTLLTQDSDVTAMVADRIYPVTMPQLEKGKTFYPALVFMLDEPGRQRKQTHNGPSPLVMSPITIMCLGPRYFEVKTLAEKVRLALNGQSAVLEAIYEDHIGAVALDKETDEYMFDQVEELSLYSVPMEFQIEHREQV